MTKMGKVMIAFGLIWIFAWCIMGVYLGMGHQAYNVKMAELAEQGNLTDFWKTFSSWKGHTVPHSHALCTSFILILMALAFPYIEYSDRVKWITGLLLIIGVALFSISDWFKLVPLIMAGGILIIAMVLVGFIGALRGIKK
ncbi:hypothetical protein J7J59_03185 [Candidatus Aerophobetes bacterium]|nr:hypothetical protein [Candidatus Aerophobetes bacterium]HHJ00622.1 hypothetical protein [Candidatus Aerophobetes bacterium]